MKMLSAGMLGLLKIFTFWMFLLAGTPSVHAARYMVSIVVGHYAAFRQDYHISPQNMHDLPGAGNDNALCDKIADFLDVARSRKYRYILFDSQATKTAVRNTFDRLRLQLQPRDIVFIFLSLHGGTVRYERLDRVDDAVMLYDQPLTLALLSSFGQQLETIGAKLMWSVDTCNSGAARTLRDSDLIPKTVAVPVIIEGSPREEENAGGRQTPNRSVLSGAQMGDAVLAACPKGQTAFQVQIAMRFVSAHTAALYRALRLGPRSWTGLEQAITNFLPKGRDGAPIQRPIVRVREQFSLPNVVPHFPVVRKKENGLLVLDDGAAGGCQVGRLVVLRPPGGGRRAVQAYVVRADLLNAWVRPKTPGPGLGWRVDPPAEAFGEASARGKPMVVTVVFGEGAASLAMRVRALLPGLRIGKSGGGKSGWLVEASHVGGAIEALVTYHSGVAMKIEAATVEEAAERVAAALELSALADLLAELDGGAPAIKVEAVLRPSKQEYQIGKGVKIQVRPEAPPEQEISIYVIDINTNGEVTLLCPNPLQNGAARGGQVITIPPTDTTLRLDRSDLKLTGPAGLEVLVVIASTKRLDLAGFQGVDDLVARLNSAKESGNGKSTPWGVAVLAVSLVAR